MENVFVCSLMLFGMTSVCVQQMPKTLIWIQKTLPNSHRVQWKINNAQKNVKHAQEILVRNARKDTMKWIIIVCFVTDHVQVVRKQETV